MRKKFLRTQDSRARLVFWLILTVAAALLVLVFVVTFTNLPFWFFRDDPAYYQTHDRPSVGVVISQIITFVILLIVGAALLIVACAFLFDKSDKVGSNFSLRDKFEGYDRFIKGAGRVLSWPFRMIGKGFMTVVRRVDDWIYSGEKS